jgi:thioredoxin-related protein
LTFFLPIQIKAAVYIEAAIKKVAVKNKYVLLQGGGKWCSWCIEFTRFWKVDKQIDYLINSSFVW